MPRLSIVYEVFIASPSDVEEEREILSQVIADWNSANARSTGIILQARRWDTDSVPSAGEDAQQVINRQLINDADILLAVFHSKLGKKTPRNVSGTAEEIENLRAKGKDVLIYFSLAPIPFEHDRSQLEKLKKYKKQLEAKFLYFSFKETEQLRQLASKHLANVVSDLARKPTCTITAPQDQSKHPREVIAEGTTGLLPLDQRLWLMVSIEKGYIYPQARLSRENSLWKQKVNIGTTATPRGEKFRLHLVSVGPKSDDFFSKVVEHDSGYKDWRFREWPSDTKILDTKILIREDPAAPEFLRNS